MHFVQNSIANTMELVVPLQLSFYGRQSCDVLRPMCCTLHTLKLLKSVYPHTHQMAGERSWGYQSSTFVLSISLGIERTLQNFDIIVIHFFESTHLSITYTVYLYSIFFNSRPYLISPIKTPNGHVDTDNHQGISLFPATESLSLSWSSPQFHIAIVHHAINHCFGGGG